MPTQFVYLILILSYLIVSVIGQENVLSYQILSQGQQIDVPLQQYFVNASMAQINDEKSTNKYADKFQVYNTSDQPYRTAFDQQLSFIYKNKTISFRNLQYYTSKSLYNQPIKLYLLTNNFLMMVIYNQHCGNSNENKVIGLNLTENLTAPYNTFKNITCTSLQTITTNEQIFQDIAYVICRGLQQGKFFSYVVVKVNLTHSAEGFIQGFSILNYTPIIRNTTCLEYSIKLFQTLKVNSMIINQAMWLFCKQRFSNISQKYPVRYFYDTQRIFTTINTNLTDCITNSSYLSANGDGGFLSLINQTIYQFYTNTTKYQSVCVPTSLRNIGYEFAANRNYNNIQITYFFVKNATIIIKSSYRTNHQKLDLNKTGYSFTSYALNQHYMAVSLCNNLGTTIMLVYQMEDLFPKLIDQRVIQTNQTCNNFVLTSTNNYLQKGYYVFFYNKTTNKLSLKQYNGYILTIKPKPQKFHPTITQLQPYHQSQNQYGYNDGLVPHQVIMTQNSTRFIFYIYAPNTTENLTITLTIRKFNNSNIQFLPFKKLNFDSPFVNFDLSTLAIGPHQRFYLDDGQTDKSVKLKFINYYSTINISRILWKQNSAGKPQQLKQLALNIQLKVTDPVLTLYYNTFIQNCNLKYIKNNQFDLECPVENIIKIKNSTENSTQTRVIVLTKDKWLQYGSSVLEFCSIIGQSGICQTLPFMDNTTIKQYIFIRKIKLIKFQQKSHNTYIELFIVYSRNTVSELAYGFFNRQQSSNYFRWNKIFIMTSKQVNQLDYMQLTNVHFDKNYNHYLLLHLSWDNILINHIALLYDHPAKIENGYFLGHLIKRFDDFQIQSILTIGNLLIIINRYGDGTANIKEFRITEFYSVIPTRTYPLYGRKIVKNGKHVADGQFLFVQVQIEKGQFQGKTQYLVFCPNQKTTNILTHTIPGNQNPLLFVQVIGSLVNKYPHSIGINGQQLYALSVPNLVVKFDYDSRKQYVLQRMLTKKQKTYIPGNFSLRLIDYQNIMYAFTYQYQFDISNQVIQYSQQNLIYLNISKDNTNSSYLLKIDKIKGPVMSIDLYVEGDCPFIKKNIQYDDIFTQLQCLAQIDSKVYGTILDLKSIQLNNMESVDIIITTKHFMCVQNHKMQYFLNITYRACVIVNYNYTNGYGLFVCDNGQGSVINTFYFSNLTEPACNRVKVSENITKPSWLIYQYFKMKYISPYAIFEVPIRIQQNKIYFLTKFYIKNATFIDKYQSFIYNSTNEVDHFLTKDFEVDLQYAYLLEEDGLGIYDLDSIQQDKVANQPLAWIPQKNITQTLNLTSELVYIKPDQQPHNIDVFNCSQKFNTRIFMEIGTTNYAYKVKICFNDDAESKYLHNQNDNRIQQFQMTVIIQYNQYKDCKNTVLSKSKSWQNLTLKLCALQVQQHRIFSNYMPITPKASQYYIQFYAVEPRGEYQKIYPFRMEKISTNDTIQISLLEGELLVRSLFSFLCYYKLDIDIKWTVYRNVSFNQQYQMNKQCKANIVLSNENFQKKYSIRIKNTDLQITYAYKPWIFRTLFICISLITLIKLRVFLQHKNIKLNKLKFNLLSNEFEFNVRLNSKKQIEQNLLYREQTQSQLGENSFRKYQP